MITESSWRRREFIELSSMAITVTLYLGLVKEYNTSRPYDYVSIYALLLSIAHVVGWRTRRQTLEVYVLDDSSNSNAPIISSNVRNILSDVQLFSRRVDEARHGRAVVGRLDILNFCPVRS